MFVLAVAEQNYDYCLTSGTDKIQRSSTVLHKESSLCLWLGHNKGLDRTKKNLRFLSKFNQNTVRCFQASFQRVTGVLVTWWCLVNFWKSRKHPKQSQKKFVKHKQIRSTHETFWKFTWNHLTVFWLNFENNLRFLFVLHDLSLSQHWKTKKTF